MQVITVDGLVFEPFIPSGQIKGAVQRIGVEISAAYADKNPVFVGVLNGCFMFMADLMKEVQFACEMSFVKLSSYSGTAQGDINELIGVGIDLRGRDVIIVEDVVDSGKSLKHTIAALEKLGAKTISVCALLVKPDCLEYDFNNLDYVGFEIAKEFIIGYGLDYNGRFRNLLDIYKETSSIT